MFEGGEVITWWIIIIHIDGSERRLFLDHCFRDQEKGKEELERIQQCIFEGRMIHIFNVATDDSEYLINPAKVAYVELAMRQRRA